MQSAEITDISDNNLNFKKWLKTLPAQTFKQRKSPILGPLTKYFYDLRSFQFGIFQVSPTIIFENAFVQNEEQKIWQSMN
jgi:hypothetical protein